MLSWQSDIITCAQEVEMMIKQLGAQMEQLQMTVKAKTAVPTSLVFVSVCHQLWPCSRVNILLSPIKLNH